MFVYIFVSIENERSICSEECTEAGCWGSNPDQCIECKHIKYNNTCLRSCENESNLYTLPDGKHCGQCHSECKQSCTGPKDSDCFDCKHVSDGNHCLTECPKSKYALNGICFSCHESCIGCTGPTNNFGEHGCKACEKVVIANNKIELCLKKDEDCPGKESFLDILCLAYFDKKSIQLKQYFFFVFFSWIL